MSTAPATHHLSTLPASLEVEIPYRLPDASALRIVGGDMNPEDEWRARVQSPIRWPIHDGITFLNHGSYGVVPLGVREERDRLRALMDRDPVEWFNLHQERLSDEARRAVGRFVKCPYDQVALVPNATFAVATVLHSVPLGAGDEVLVTDHEYDATMNELGRLAARKGFRVVKAHVPFPIAGPEQVVEAIEARITERTKLIVMSHITSATALIMPAAEIVRLGRERGIRVLIDGAHGRGQIPVDLGEMQPDYYAASCHKWLCTPKGTGFFYARPEFHHEIKTLALSCRVHRARPDRPSFLSDFDYVGTSDNTGNLTLPFAIEHLGSQVEGGWPALMRRNHEAIVAARRTVCGRLGIELPCPDEMLGMMASIPLPQTVNWRDPKHASHPHKGPYGDPLWNTLAAKHRIQVPIWAMDAVGARVLRISNHLHNAPEQYARLAEALAVELGR